MKANYNAVFKKFSYKIMQFGKIKKFIDKATRILVYKQTIFPLVEYVSFMLYPNRNCDIEKIQRLQNRCLRMCLDIRQPIDMTVNDLHVNAKIETLESQRSRQLIKKMFNLVQNNKYKKEGVRVTRTLDTFGF